MSPPPLVDYAVAATRYDAGRALAPVVLDRWGAAVTAAIGPVTGRHVVDVGAGTGLFAEAWKNWGAARVTSVEPSAAMRAVAVERTGGRVALLAGAADRLPLASGTTGVAWLSAVVHHLPDPVVAGRELHRVLRRGGSLLVRGFVPGASSLPWLDHVPGHQRAVSRFPDLTRLDGWFTTAGFDRTSIDAVVERDRVIATESADWIDQMRGADSLLTALTTAELDAGTAALRALGETDLGPVTLTLVAYRRR